MERPDEAAPETYEVSVRLDLRVMRVLYTFMGLFGLAAVLSGLASEEDGSWIMLVVGGVLVATALRGILTRHHVVASREGFHVDGRLVAWTTVRSLRVEYGRYPGLRIEGEGGTVRTIWSPPVEVGEEKVLAWWTDAVGPIERKESRFGHVVTYRPGRAGGGEVRT